MKVLKFKGTESCSATDMAWPCFFSCVEDSRFGPGPARAVLEAEGGALYHLSWAEHRRV